MCVYVEKGKLLETTRADGIPRLEETDVCKYARPKDSNGKAHERGECPGKSIWLDLQANRW
jgi:hypothetical protein